MDHSYLLSLSSFTTVPSFLNFPHLLSWIFLLLFFWNWQRWDLSVFSSSWIPVSFGFVPFLHGISSLDLSSDNFRPFIFFAVFLFRALFSSYFISRLFFHQRLPISFGLPPFFSSSINLFFEFVPCFDLPSHSFFASLFYLSWMVDWWMLVISSNNVFLFSSPPLSWLIRQCYMNYVLPLCYLLFQFAIGGKN